MCLCWDSCALTPWSWGSPWTAARPEWTHVWWYLAGSAAASEESLWHTVPPSLPCLKAPSKPRRFFDRCSCVRNIKRKKGRKSNKKSRTETKNYLSKVTREKRKRAQLVRRSEETSMFRAPGWTALPLLLTARSWSHSTARLSHGRSDFCALGWLAGRAEHIRLLPAPRIWPTEWGKKFRCGEPCFIYEWTNELTEV